MGLRERLRRLEHSAESEIATLVCQECGEEFRVRQGIELDLVAQAWAEGAKERGHKVYGETPEDVHRINAHRCGWQALRHKYTGEPLFPWGIVHEE
jgi:uncharacterized protein YbaR (Trm112 family)